MKLTVAVPVVLYGNEAWSLIPKYGHKPRVFENGMLKRNNRRMEKITL
jgi:hypothetical protein